MEYSIHARRIAPKSITTVQNRETLTMPGSVSGAGNNFNINSLANGAQKVAIAYGKNGMQGVSNIWEQYAQSQITNTTDNLVDAAFGDSYVGAAVKGISQAIISAILGGNMSAITKETADAQQSLTEVQNLSNQAQQLSDQTNQESQAIISQTQGEVDAGQSEIETAVNEINSAAEEATATIETHTEEVETSKEQIDENTKEIENKQNELKEIDAQIQKLVNEQNIKVPKKDDSGGDGVDNMDFSALEGGDNSELTALLAKRSGLASSISKLQNDNLTAIETITNGSASTSELVQSVADISTEKAAFIDQRASEILQTVNDAKGAITELSNFLNGQLPQLDKAMTTRIATIVTKGAINGTNSGIMAGIAASLGASSIVSFGSTAMQAKNAAEGSVGYGTASAKDIANAAIEKTFEQYATNYMKNQLSQLSNIIGVDVNGILDMVEAFNNETKETTVKDFVVDDSQSKVEDTLAQLDKETDLNKDAT